MGLVTHTRQSAIALTVLGLLFIWPLVMRPSAGARAYSEPPQAAVPAAATVGADDAIGDRSPQKTTEFVTMRDGDSLTSVFARIGLSSSDAQAAIHVLQGKLEPRDLQAGQEIAVERNGALIAQLRFSPDLQNTIVLSRNRAGDFVAATQPRELTRLPIRVTGRIDTSLFDAAMRAGVPQSVLAEMIAAFSYDVDFQRELQPGDSFEILYDTLIDDESGKIAGAGDVAYAALTLSGRTLALYRFAPKSGEPGFYDASGASVKKELLRTPVDGARISSGFGLRHHPILGYTRMHKGVDFAVPAGTPILASGDAVVQSAGRSGGYGNLVVLRHSNNYATAYGHMSRIAKGIRPGRHVRQGQVIGYVGMTGLATGPHLHYEVRVADKAINPLNVHMETTQRLAGRELNAFHQEEVAVARRLAALRAASPIAQN